MTLTLVACNETSVNHHSKVMANVNAFCRQINRQSRQKLFAPDLSIWKHIETGNSIFCYRAPSRFLNHQNVVNNASLIPMGGVRDKRYTWFKFNSLRCIACVSTLLRHILPPNLSLSLSLFPRSPNTHHTSLFMFFLLPILFFSNCDFINLYSSSVSRVTRCPCRAAQYFWNDWNNYTVQQTFSVR